MPNFDLDFSIEECDKYAVFLLEFYGHILKLSHVI